MELQEHNIEITYNPKRGYTPRCSCGWIGEPCPSYYDADEVASCHILSKIPNDLITNG